MPMFSLLAMLADVVSGFLIPVVHTICPNRNWFATYQAIASDTVLMGNHIPYKLVGRMHNGIVRTLSDVWHVLDLRKNLISLGTVDSNGYMIEAKC